MFFFVSCLTKAALSLFLSLSLSLLSFPAFLSLRGRHRRVRSRLRGGFLLVRDQRAAEDVDARGSRRQRRDRPGRRAGTPQPHSQGRARRGPSRRAVPGVALASPEILDGAVDGGEDGADEGEGDGGGGGGAA